MRYDIIYNVFLAQLTTPVILLKKNVQTEQHRLRFIIRCYLCVTSESCNLSNLFLYAVKKLGCGMPASNIGCFLKQIHQRLN